jgi:CheY-like chemotaxis protein
MALDRIRSHWPRRRPHADRRFPRSTRPVAFFASLAARDLELNVAVRHSEAARTANHFGTARPSGHRWRPVRRLHTDLERTHHGTALAPEDAPMRVLVVDDSLPRRRLLTALLGKAGHEIVTAPNGSAALDLLASQAVDAVVSDVKMPVMDGFQLCHALRRDARWQRMPFIFYSSIFIGDRAHALGMDLGATAYLDAKHVAPDQVAKEIEVLVNRMVGAEYREGLVRLRDDLEFARRYHAIVLASLDTDGHAGVRDTISSNVRALDDILTRLDAERRALVERTDVIVPVSELNHLKELSEYLGDKINTPLGVILGGARPTTVPTDATTEAAASVRTAVRRINELVRRITKRDRSDMGGTRHG